MTRKAQKNLLLKRRGGDEGRVTKEQRTFFPTTIKPEGKGHYKNDFFAATLTDLVVGGGLDVLQVDGPQLAQDEGVEQAEQGGQSIQSRPPWSLPAQFGGVGFFGINYQKKNFYTVFQK